MRASRLNRSAVLTLSPSSGSKTFRATARRNPTSDALKITPIPPRASSRSTSYSPASTMRTRWNSASGSSASKTTVALCGSTTGVPQLAQKRAPSAIAAPQRKQVTDKRGPPTPGYEPDECSERDRRKGPQGPYHLAQGTEDTVKDAGSPAKVSGLAAYATTAGFDAREKASWSRRDRCSAAGTLRAVSWAGILAHPE